MSEDEKTELLKFMSFLKPLIKEKHYEKMKEDSKEYAKLYDEVKKESRGFEKLFSMLEKSGIEVYHETDKYIDRELKERTEKELLKPKNLNWQATVKYGIYLKKWGICVKVNDEYVLLDSADLPHSMLEVDSFKNPYKALYDEINKKYPNLEEEINEERKKTC